MTKASYIWSFVTVAFGGICVGTSYLAVRRFNEAPPVEPPVAPWATYDWEAAEARLTQLGGAPQKYRKHNGILPVAQRKSDMDAGIACGVEDVLIRLTEKGKPWTVPRAAAYAPEEIPNVPGAIFSSLTCVASKRRFDSPREPSGADWKSIWAKRGESVPIYMDTTMHAWSETGKQGVYRPVLILRLGGQVERVEVDISNRREILLTK